MPIVEFFGCPGVGKTTLFPKVMKLLARRRTKAIIDEYDVVKRIALKTIERRRNRIRFELRRAAVSVPHKISRALAHHWYRPRWSQIIGPHETELQAFVSFALPLIARCGSVPTWVAAMRTDLFLQKLARVHYAEEFAADEIVLFEEAFGHRGVALGLSDPDAKDLVRQYFEMMPLPAHLMHIKASKEVVEERLLTREGEEGHILPKIDEAIQWADMGAAILAKRGCPVSEVWNETDDAATAVADKLEAIRAQLILPRVPFLDGGEAVGPGGHPSNLDDPMQS